MMIAATPKMEETNMNRKKAGRKPRAAEETMTRRELAVNVHKKLGRRARCSAGPRNSERSSERNSERNPGHPRRDFYCRDSTAPASFKPSSGSVFTLSLSRVLYAGHESKPSKN